MRTNPYDEAKALERYVAHTELLMTDFEERSLHLAIKRELGETFEELRDRLPKWLAQESEEVRQASLAGPAAIRRQVAERIQRQLCDGSLWVNRCPRCGAIVQTPQAKRCFYCGHDWHGG